jgi:hypothetical protein
MLQSNQRIAIVVAVIGVIGSLGAAFVANWDKFFVPSPQPPPKIDSRSPAESIPNLSGLWRDSNDPNNGSQISQDGNRVHFTRWGVLPNGMRFESSGSGVITGHGFTSNYNAKYQSGATSTGDCSGTVSPDGTRMELNCSDSLLGAFSGTAIRQ